MKKYFIFFIVLIFLLSTGFTRDLQEIIKSGYLIVGMRELPSIYMYDKKTGIKSGICYDIIKGFADELGLKLYIKSVNNFDDYWKLNNKIPENIDKNTSISYTPDIYKNIDIATEIFTIMPWRKRLIEMIPILENTEILYTRKETKVSNFKDLIGKKIILVKGMSFQFILEEKFKELKIPYVENFAELSDNFQNIKYISKNKVSEKDYVEIILIKESFITKTLLYPAIITQKKADAGIMDSFSLFFYLKSENSFRHSINPAFSLTGKIDTLAFGSSFQNPKLNQKLNEFIKKSKTNGFYDKILGKYYGFSYKEYLELLNKIK